MIIPIFYCLNLVLITFVHTLNKNIKTLSPITNTISITLLTINNVLRKSKGEFNNLLRNCCQVFILTWNLTLPFFKHIYHFGNQFIKEDLAIQPHSDWQTFKNNILHSVLFLVFGNLASRSIILYFSKKLLSLHFIKIFRSLFILVM